MVEVTTNTFGKSFLLAGIIPALVWIVLHDLLLLPWLSKIQPLYEINFLGLKGGAYPVFTLLLAILLLTFNELAIQWLTSGWPLSGWLIRYNKNRHAKTYTAFLLRRSNYQESLKKQNDIEVNLQKLDIVYDLLQKEAFHLHFPCAADHLQATRLGNVFAVVSEYAYERYRMDASIYWSRLSIIIPSDYKSQIADAKTSLDFWLHLCVLTFIFALETFILSWWLKAIFLLLYGVIALALAYGLYRIAVDMAYSMSILMLNCFDLFRHDLLAKFGIPKPQKLAAEQQLWIKLATFIRYGETVDYPLN